MSEAKRFSKLSILVCSHYLPSHIGGIERVAAKQAETLAKRGYHVTSLTSRLKGYELPEITNENHNIIAIKAWNGLERFGVPYPIFSPSLILKTFRAVRQCDIVHVHDAFYQTSLIATLASRFYNKPLFLTQHVDLVQHKSKLVELVQRIIYQTSGRFIFLTAHNIFVYNDRIASFLKAYGVSENRIVVTTNGVDPDRFRPVRDQEEKQALRRKYHLPPNRTLVLFVGRLVHKKGYQRLLDAWQRDNCDLVFAGSKVAPPDFKVEPGVWNLGGQPQPALAEIYRACDIFALPSVGEGFPMSIQEAMASGLPVITTDDAGYGRYNFSKEYVKLVRPEVPALSQALTSMLESTDAQRAEMSQYGRDYACKHFAWDRLIDEKLLLYDEALGESGQ